MVIADTLTSNIGSIAEGFYRIHQEVKHKALSMLDEPLLAIIRRWHQWMIKKQKDIKHSEKDYALTGKWRLA